MSSSSSDYDDAHDAGVSADELSQGHEALSARPAHGKSSSNRRRAIDDEDNDDEDDEEGDDHGRPQKKQRTANRFLELEAEVDEDEDEDEEDEEEEVGFIDREEEIVPDAEEYLEADARSRRELDRRFTEQSDADLQKMAARFDQRYKKTAGARRFVESGAKPQHLLMPSVKDPKLWMIRCKPGKEKEIVFNLMRKYFDREFAHNPIRLHSAFCREDLKGYVYVEADVPAHVQEATDKMNGLYLTKMTLVPVKEMPDTLTVNKLDEAASLLEGGWVRIKRSKYANDLAQVLQVAETGDIVTVRLIPRIDMHIADKSTTAEDRKRKKYVTRPPQKLFNPRDLPPQMQRAVSRGQRGAWIFAGETYKDGFLEKDVRITSLATQGITPTLDEITSFSGQSGDIVDANMLHSLQQTAITQSASHHTRLQPGDAVEITSGELTRVHGVVESVSGSLATIVPRVTGLRDKITIPLTQLQRRFNIGDHVKVVQGKHKDETGMILSITDTVATIFSDICSSEIKVFIRDLSEAGDISAPTTALNIGKYDLHDLVVFDNNLYGVVVRIDQDVYQVLDATNNVRTVRYNQIRAKRDSRNSLATDSEGTTVGMGESVRTADGTRQGTILHIQRNAVWMHCRDMSEQAGIYATPASKLVCMVEKQKHRPIPTKNNTSGQTTGMFPASNGVNSTPVQTGSGPVGLGRGRGRGRRDPLMGATVKIAGGAYKGYMGLVKDVTEAMARVELHTNCKVVNIERMKLLIRDNTGNFYNPNGSSGFGAAGSNTGGSIYGSAFTPNSRAQGSTPLSNSGSRTPAYGAGQGSRTPAWSSDSRTPNPYGSAQTPNPYATDGGRTPAWDASSRTPGHSSSSNDTAWGMGNRTPGRFDDIGSFTPRPSGGMTPRPHSSNATPSWGGTSSRNSESTWNSNNNNTTSSAPTWGSNSASTWDQNESTSWGDNNSCKKDDYKSNSFKSSSNNVNASSVSNSGWGGSVTPKFAGVPSPGSSKLPNEVPATATPGSNYYSNNPTTPSRSVDVDIVERFSSSNDSWATEGIEVQFVPHKILKDSFQDGEYDGQRAAIDRVNGKSVTVRISGALREVPVEYLDPVRPDKKDSIKIIGGEHKGQLGNLIGIDGSDGIVKLTGAGSDFKILDIKHLGRVAT